MSILGVLLSIYLISIDVRAEPDLLPRPAPTRTPSAVTRFMDILEELRLEELRPEELSAALHDSAHAVILDAVIPDGVIYSRAGRAAVASQIRRQLSYLIGSLNAYGAGPELGRFSIQLTRYDTQVNAAGLHKVGYVARGVVVWPSQRRFPAQLGVKLPAQGDERGLRTFFNTYGAACKEDSGLSFSENYWYHYRPENSGCPLAGAGAATAASADPTAVTRARLQLSRGTTQTSGRSPEYGKIWEDGVLRGTFIFAKNQPFADNRDVGAQAYFDFISLLARRFGRPLRRSSTALPSTDFVLRHQGRTLDIRAYLVEGMGHLTDGFLSSYRERLQASDLVSYNGHAGLGENLRILGRIASYPKNRYQIFMLNGCDSLAYVDAELFARHAAANPGYAPTKHLDLVANGMPAYFRSLASDSVGMLLGLLQQKTYRQILSQFDPVQRATVSGEQDNAWPRPF